jgi:protein-tyrosine phosphatase
LELRARSPKQHRHKIRLMRELDPAPSGDLDVPDPYYDGEQAFEGVFGMLDACCRKLLDELRE